MKKKLRLLKAWGGKAIGTIVEVDEAEVKSLVNTGYAEAYTPGTKLKLLKLWNGQPVGTVVEVAEADVASLVDTKFAEPYTDPGTDLGQAAIDTLLTKFRDGLEGVVKTVTANIIASSKKHVAKGAVATALVMGVAGGGARNDDEETWGYKGISDFGREVRIFCNPSQKTLPERLAGYISKTPTGMQEGLYEDGGVLVPTQLAAGIYERVFDQQNLVAGCDVYNLTGNTIEFPGLADDSRANGSRWGGIRGYWIDEAGQITNSKPKFTNLKLRLHKLGVMVYMTDELMADSSVALDQWLSRKAGDEINFMTSDAIINGNAINKPLGILNSPSLIPVTRTTTNKIKFEDISNMWTRVWSPFRSKAVWYVNQEVEPQLDQLTFNVKNAAGSDNVGGWPLYIPPGGLNSSPYGMLKGRPVIPLEWSPALGSTGDIMLCDLSQYLIGTKQGIQSAMSIHLRFDYDETAFRFIYRVDGQPWWNKKLTPYKGTNTYSPFVALAA